IQRTPDIYLAELQDELEQAFEEVVSKQTIWRSLRARGYTQKKATQEHDEHKRNTYQLYVGSNFNPDQLVFVDESGVN
ncbi:hypothetical protein FIBSPDRAFT_671214, partial [Athelia psychrophila]